MDQGDWAELAIYVWLSAYIGFFIAACVLLKKAKNLGRWFIFSGTLLLLYVNFSLFAIAQDMIEMTYSPHFESSQWKSYGFGPPYYPAWQRYFYWGTVLADLLGKTLAGVGFIMEARQLTKIMRDRYMMKFQTETNHPTN